MEVFMKKTTLEIPEVLIHEAMNVTKIRSKSRLVNLAIKNLIKSTDIKQIKNYSGKLKLDIDIEALRAR
jgi:Arc/MetJ family transcription regulator